MYHLLVVDDEEKIRGLIRKYAEFEGHRGDRGRPTVWKPCACAVKTDASILIIMDIMMPELDGFSAVPGDPQNLRHAGDDALGPGRGIRPHSRL